MWQKAHQFVLLVYKYTESFPKSEVYGLSSQFRRAAVSIAANIAEGYKKKGKADKARFFNIAQGSLEECQYYLILSSDLGFGDASKKQSLLDEPPVSKCSSAATSHLLSAYSCPYKSAVPDSLGILHFSTNAKLCSDRCCRNHPPSRFYDRRL